MANLTWPKCRHGRVVCSQCIVITDAAKRFSDGVNLICQFSPFIERKRSWIAVKLADGQVDLNLYPSKSVAIRHQGNEFLCAYLCLRNVMGGLAPKDAAIWLQLHRYMYDQGTRLSDPDERSIIMPLGYDQTFTRPVNG
jgi:hypothetical protein